MTLLILIGALGLALASIFVLFRVDARRAVLGDAITNVSKAMPEMNTSTGHVQGVTTFKADAYLAQAKEIAADVDTWPDWKKAGFFRKNTP
jgi:hypothetical protein